MKVTNFLLWAMVVSWVVVFFAIGLVALCWYDPATIDALILFIIAAGVITFATWAFLRTGERKVKFCLALVTLTAFVGCATAGRTKQPPPNRPLSGPIPITMVVDTMKVKPETAAKLYAAQDSLAALLKVALKGPKPKTKKRSPRRHNGHRR